MFATQSKDADEAIPETAEVARQGQALTMLRTRAYVAPQIETHPAACCRQRPDGSRETRQVFSIPFRGLGPLQRSTCRSDSSASTTGINPLARFAALATTTERPRIAPTRDVSIPLRGLLPFQLVMPSLMKGRGRKGINPLSRSKPFPTRKQKAPPAGPTARRTTGA